MTYDINSEFSECGFVQMGECDFRDATCDKRLSIRSLNSIVGDTQVLEEFPPLFVHLQRHVWVDIEINGKANQLVFASINKKVYALV